MGLGTIVLGLLAVIGIDSLTLVLVALLILGAAAVFSRFAMTFRGNAAVVVVGKFATNSLGGRLRSGFSFWKSFLNLGLPRITLDHLGLVRNRENEG